jgi:hypothetical protein
LVITPTDQGVKVSYVILDGKKIDIVDGITHVIASKFSYSNEWNLLGSTEENSNFLDPYAYAAHVRKTNKGAKARVLKVRD